MSAQQKSKILLSFGADSLFEYDPGEEMSYSFFPGAPSLEDAELSVISAIDTPLDFPPLEKAIIPDDRITIAIEANLPGADLIVAKIWSILESCEITPGQVTIIQTETEGSAVDPRKLLPVEIRSLIHWKTHDPEDKDGCSYLATAMSGERIDLASSLVEADFVISVGMITYDPVLGCQGTSSILFPGLSNKEAYQKTIGQGHDELGPAHVRPIRQLVDEVGWLLGTQYTVQMIPGNQNGFSHVISGLVEAVQKEGERILENDWQFHVSSRPETVVASIDLDEEQCNWNHLASAIASARRIVARDGRIILLTEMKCEPGDALNVLRSTDQTEEITSLLKQTGSADARAAIEIAKTSDWANIYLLSRMNCDLVEDLQMIPLDDQKQVKRLLSDSESVVFLQSAQHVFATVKD